MGSRGSAPFAFVDILLRRSFMDLSKINPMTTVWCGFSHDGELLFAFENKVVSTKRFQLGPEEFVLHFSDALREAMSGTRTVVGCGVA